MNDELVGWLEIAKYLRVSRVWQGGVWIFIIHRSIIYDHIADQNEAHENN